MAGTTQVALPRDAAEGIVTYCKRAMELMHSQFSLRPSLENIDKYYMMEGNTGEDDVMARTANRVGNKRRFRDVTVPVVMPQVEAALGYYTTVFLQGSPIFAVASTPEYEQAALQINALMKKHGKSAKWARQLIMFWRDGLKYNLQGIECDWEQRTTYALETKIDFKGGKPKEVVWNGNVLRRMDLYNTFFDPRVAPAEVHEHGEFAGYNRLLSRVQMKKFINSLFGTVPPEIAVAALNSGLSGSSVGNSATGFYIPQINPEALRNPANSEFDWTAWMTATPSRSGIDYKNMYLVTKLYARILPSDFGMRVPAANTPQVWKFYIVNGQVALYAERLTNAHDNIPIIFGQPIEDGLNYQTKSFAQNVMPMQDIGSAFWNATMASQRKAVNDREYYDPSRIRAADINSPNPCAKIPVRPSAYGKNPGDAIYVSPYRDDLSQSFVARAGMIKNYADLINGQNAATQGQFTKGNRTQHEYQDIVGHSNTRNQLLVVSTEGQVHTPLKEMLLLNILQYQEAETVTSVDNKSTVDVDPVVLRQAVLEFEACDGADPIDKEMSTEELISAMQVIGSTQQLASGYKMPKLFSYLMQLRGADLSPFEKTDVENQYDQQLAAWQQAAMLAAQKGAAFSTPMPQPPQQQQIQQEEARKAQLAKQSVAGMLQTLGQPAAGNPDTSGVQQPPVPGA